MVAVTHHHPPATADERWISTRDGHELYLRCVRPEALARSPAVVFVHGLFSDSRFFLSGERQGPAAHFLRAGHPVFLVDLRGHGKSRPPPQGRGASSGFDDYVRDLEAVFEAISAEQGRFIVMAHSMGGYTALATLGLHPHLQGSCAGVCIASTAIYGFDEMKVQKFLVLNFADILSRILGTFPARALKVGVADEPHALMHQFARWANRDSFDSADGAIDYWALLAQVRVPVLSLVGAIDRFYASPARAEKLLDQLGSSSKEFLVCGLSRGFSRDFGHVDIVRGSAAEKEVLPRVSQWLEELPP